jgi:phosphatidylserine decarboxylase
MIRIHREGRLIVVLTVVIIIILAGLSARYLPGEITYLISALAMAVLILVMRFFRIPKRRPFLEDKTIVAPADGKVVAIERVEPDEYLQTSALQVSIFMSIHNVHINYYPVPGKISYLKYHPGKYLLAKHPKSSTLNERYSTGIDTAYGPVLVRQIAGYVARRIKNYGREGRMVKQGKEMGFIKFGSRLDLFIPLDAEIKVKLNQKVTGSVTPLARFK